MLSLMFVYVRYLLLAIPEVCVSGSYWALSLMFVCVRYLLLPVPEVCVSGLCVRFILHAVPEVCVCQVSAAGYTQGLCVRFILYAVPDVYVMSGISCWPFLKSRRQVHTTCCP